MFPHPYGAVSIRGGAPESELAPIFGAVPVRRPELPVAAIDLPSIVSTLLDLGAAP
jgi:hypothetical protein